jgi:hypothetical protein
MWVDYDVPNWFLISKNFYRSPFSKWPPQYRTNSTLFEFNILNWFLTSKNFYRSPFSKWPPQYRKNSTLFDFRNVVEIGQCWIFAVFWKRRIAPLMVTYHYVKFYVSIIIHLEVVNINVRNFNFPIGFYSNPHPLWTPQNMPLTLFTTKLKTLGPTRNIYL